MSCVLCGLNPPIKESHIVPKFVFKRLKQGSPLDSLRNSENINKPYQDGWKGDYLCEDCEARFSKWEDWFVKAVYDSFRAGAATTFPYDERLALFAASLHFRNYAFQTRMKPGAETAGDKALAEELRQMCLTSVAQRPGVHQYVQLLVPIKTIDVFPPGVNTYLFEAADLVVMQWKDGRSLSFVKLPDVLFVTSSFDLNTEMPEPHLLDGHLIHPAGILDLAAQSGALLAEAKDHVIGRTTGIQANYTKMSAAQFQKIQDKINADPDKEKSRAHRTYEWDLALLKLSENKKT
jgi:hypothetical protein